MPTVPVVPPLRTIQIESRAEDIIKRLYPDAWSGKTPVPVDHFFEIILPETLGIRTCYTNLEGFGVSAQGYTNSTSKVSMVDSRISDDSTKHGKRYFRSTVGHESGHCVLHVPLQSWQQSLQMAGVGMKRERSTMEAYEDPEWQAWKFCEAFCMPRHLMQKKVRDWGTTPTAIKALADFFDVNESFIRTRLRALKIPY